MSLIHYWPTEQFITQCIRTEAEELPEHVLLAVHEPMNLQRVGTKTEVKTEYDLLEDFLNTERPIPIVGRSGVGKSHLIRWINAQLKLKPECKDWHIVRIPKNSSLRQVLELLLAGLEGDVFEKARQSIHTVGEEFTTKNIGEHLLTFMSQQLVKLRESVQRRIEEIHQNQELKNSISAEERNRIRTILKHTMENKGLSELITDPYFKQYLLRPEHCIYKFAERLTTGAKDTDLAKHDYLLHAQDLNFSFNIADLSSVARVYVEKVCLNQLTVREEAVAILNEVLSEANKALFRQLFSFSSGSFVDLFKAIRRLLKQKDQILVILVEDMAAISAIEDVLIDSLLEESITDGEQDLCVLRSAIAVTDGYLGYARRKDTIKTRAQYEWHISEQVEAGSQLNQRIVEFVARYLNAARFGSEALRQQWQDRSTATWPPIWSENDQDEVLQAFGYSPQLNIALFPFNQNAILALAHQFCTEEGQLKFNPRKVLNQIVLKVLKKNRAVFEAQKFPYAHFADMSTSVDISSRLSDFHDISRCISVAAIWGYDSRTMDQLAQRLNYRVVQAFGLDDFAQHLQQYLPTTVDLIPEVTQGINVRGVVKHAPVFQEEHSTVVPTRSVPKDPLQQEFEQIDLILEQWLKPEQARQLDQDNAKILRQELEQMFSTYVLREQYSFNLSAEMMRKIKTSTGRIYIEIPNAQSNLNGCILKYFNEEELKELDKRLDIQRISLALLRNAKAQQKGRVAWDYPHGYSDFLTYQNFAMHWVPSVMLLFIHAQQQQVEDVMLLQIQMAYQLGAWKDADNLQQKLECLLLDQYELTYFGQAPLFSNLKQELEHWDKTKMQWLNCFSDQNSYIYEGKKAFTLFKKLEKKVFAPTVLTKMANQIERDVKRELVPLFSDFQCQTREAYSSALQLMIKNIEQVSRQGKYYPIQHVSLPSAKVFAAAVKVIDNMPTWEMVKNIMQLIDDIQRTERGVNWEKVIAQVQRIDATYLNEVLQVFDYWKEFYRVSFTCIKQDNDRQGAVNLEQQRQQIDRLFENLAQSLQGLQ